MLRLLLALALAPAVMAPAARADAPLVVWSSGPLTGAAAPIARDVRDAERLALEESGSPGIVLRPLNDATPASGSWDPGKTAENARRAASDAATIAYLGEFNSGATAIALPILNEAGVPEISATSTYVGLTRSHGGQEGEPDKYYPT